MNGIINVYKEKGFTSFDVCAKLRGILHQKKIGHTGTLDPDAEGVLPVCVGNATKLCDLLTDKDKVYETVLLLGVSTDTQDISGQVLKEVEVSSNKEEVTQAIMSFVGTYDQIPPMYSAIKVNGKKLYELARQGIEIERKARKVTIHDIEILSMDFDEKNTTAVKEVRMRVHCSKGTYIRTLCEDIGNKLSCGGCMKELLRTKVSIFTIENSLSLSQIEEYMKNDKIDEICLPVDSLFMQCKEFCVKEEFNKFVYNGNKLRFEHLQTTLQDCVKDSKIDGEQVVKANCIEDDKQVNLENCLEPNDNLYRIYDSFHKFIGLYTNDEENHCLNPVKMFLN